MIKVNIIAVGKVKEAYFVEGINEYAKRLSKYCDFKIVELAEENYKKVDDSIIKDIVKKEGDKILSCSALKGTIFAMAIEGQKISSEKLASKIKGLSDMGQTITFVIGGSYGLDNFMG